MAFLEKIHSKISENGEEKRAKRSWIYHGMIASLIVTLIFTAYYGTFRNRARAYIYDPVENEVNISWLYESSFVLYRDLYNLLNATQNNYKELYLDVNEGYEWILDEDKLNDYVENFYYESSESEEDLATESAEAVISPVEDTAYVKNLLEQQDAENILYYLGEFQNYFTNLEGSFEDLNHYYDYCIVDHATGRMVTNMSAADVKLSPERYFQVSFVFDNAGNVSVGEEIYATDAAQIRKLANGVIRENGMTNPVENEISAIQNYSRVLLPANCTITFSISHEAWADLEGTFRVNDYGNGIFSCTRNAESNLRYAYTEAGVESALTCAFLLLGLLGCVLTLNASVKSLKDDKLCACTLEVLVVGGFCWYGFGGNGLVKWVSYVAEGTLQSWMLDTLRLWSNFAALLAHIFNLLFMGLFFFGGWYIGVCISAARQLGFKQYIKQRSLIYRIFPYLKGKMVATYTKVANLDLTKDAHKTIMQLLTVNGVILFVISSLWVAGWAVVIIYSLILYVILRKYVSDLQKRYGILLRATNEIAKGNLNVIIEENLGVFEPFKPEIIKIQEGFKNAVEQEVKSQRMKAELITNVSHDLKTPLTAIITYVNLLKEKNISEEQRKEYLDTLERKSLRLKVLIEDLFEVSKANSNNITLNIMDVDIMHLVKQVSFEMNDKLEAADLDVRINLPEGRIILPLDSQKTYRVYENLFGNVAKYAMPGTRVYVSGALREGCVEIIIKNITAQEITVDSTELTERFVRNDSSRNTEGSGLGLAIAKSFMELQGGDLKVEVDGDLFKATTTWKLS